MGRLHEPGADSALVPAGERELRLGGRYQLEGNASGTVERCDPPKSFFATWEFDGKVSWIEVRMSPEAANKTRLEVDHIAHVDEHWTQFGPGAAGVGWDMILMGLRLHLSGAPRGAAGGSSGVGCVG